VIFLSRHQFRRSAFPRNFLQSLFIFRGLKERFMARFRFNRLHLTASLILLSIFINGCASSANSRFFGKTQAPTDNILRYVSGSEPATLDPQLSTGQPEARIFMALYEGLVEYDPKTQLPIPAIAKSWETSPNVDEFVFHLRDNAKWSDGKPITANDFVYSFRRGFRPDTLSPTAELGYFIKYAEAFNGKKVFVKKNGEFLPADGGTTTVNQTGAVSNRAPFGPETEFYKSVRSPERLTLDSDETKRNKQLDADPKLKAAVEGAEFVPVEEEDIGVEAVDNYTLRIVLRQPVPFFVGLLAYQFFRLVPQQSVEKYGKNWTRAGNIVTCGAFKIKSIRPYDSYVLEKDPNYWDAANVHLNGIEFYPVEENSTIVNLYKAGIIDAFLNHAIPASWIDEVRQYKDEYLDFAENSTTYYSMNMTKPPFNDKKVRQALSLAVNREALSKFRKVTKPLYYQTPSGTFPDYDKAMAKVGEEIRKERGISAEEWEKDKKLFNPEKARKLLAEAGFTVQQNGNDFSCPSFPADKIALNYNTNESNKQVAEFVQSQWRQNLGITVPLKSQEFKTFIPERNALRYDGLAQSLWSGDYMDPYTFLGLHYGKGNNGGSGFYDPKYDRMLDDANSELDPQKRYEKLARAEYYLLDERPVIPLSISATNWMKKPYVKGLYPNPGTLFAWKFVYIETNPNKWDKDVENVMSETDPQVEAQLKTLTSTQNTAQTAK
jgi:oligopeptide transport system substrate-binding protein